MFRTAVICAALAAALAWPQPVRAQVEDPNPGRFRMGPLGVTPTFRITNLGWDNNVFNEDEKDGPRSDVTAVVSPGAELWLRLPRARLQASSQFEYHHYRDLEDLSALDSTHSARLDVPLNRLAPYVVGYYSDTQHHLSLEVDTLDRRRIEGAGVGSSVRLTAKGSVVLYGNRTRLRYNHDATARGTELAQALDHTSTMGGLSFRYELTPLTTLALSVERSEDEFAASLQRDSRSLLVMPSIEFKPAALISGRATMGFRKRTSLTGFAPEFRGSVLMVDLRYTLLGQTQFSVNARRDLEYSHLEGQLDYLVTWLTVGATQRMGERWDLGGRVGVYRSNYLQLRSPGPSSATEAPIETVLTTYGDVGYRLGRTRVGFYAERFGRTSDVAAGRQYDRLRVGSSITYLF